MEIRPSLTKFRLVAGIVVFLLCYFFLCDAGGGVAVAWASNQATFSWHANPSDNNIKGYRLYCGIRSRFDVNGQLKTGFSYSYYLDFSTSQRCRLTKSGSICRQYSDKEVHCEGLNGETPKCTLYGLSGYKYFTMTAYNDREESSYTSELKFYQGALAFSTGWINNHTGTTAHSSVGLAHHGRIAARTGEKRSGRVGFIHHGRIAARTKEKRSGSFGFTHHGRIAGRAVEKRLGSVGFVAPHTRIAAGTGDNDHSSYSSAGSVGVRVEGSCRYSGNEVPPEVLANLRIIYKLLLL